MPARENRVISKMAVILTKHMQEQRFCAYSYVLAYGATDRAAIYGRSSDQKESPVDWTPHEDVTRQATKPGSLLPTVFWSEKERAPSSPVQGYHQVKPEAERHKDRLMEITLTAER